MVTKNWEPMELKNQSKIKNGSKGKQRERKGQQELTTYGNRE